MNKFEQVQGTVQGGFQVNKFEQVPSDQIGLPVLMETEWQTDMTENITIP